MSRRRVGLLILWVALLIAFSGVWLMRPEPALAQGLSAQATGAEARLAWAGWPVEAAGSPLVLGALLAASTLVSEDLACVTAGLLVAEGRLGIFAAVLSCFLGIFVGDLGLLAAGRWIGRPLLRLPPLRWWVSEAAVDRASAWYRQNGPVVIFTSRFMPGARLPLYVAAGLLRTPALRFAGWFALAGAVWTPLLVGGSALLGARAEALLRDGRAGLLWGALMAGAMVLGLRAVVPLATWRGRRLALGWWRRQTRWEFWPMHRVYPTVVLHLLRLAVRHRSLTVFTACNPGIPLGGVVGESKRDIYERLGGDANPRVPATLWLAADEPAARRLEAARSWRLARGLGWPIVIKPDAGQRGQGVVIARDEATFEAAIGSATCDTLVQEHVAGVEYGLFYVRRAGRARGELYSITEKRPLDVVGDGVSTLEALILADDRAVCMAPTHLARHAARLGEIPADGERVRLVEIGTHSQGSVFLNAAPVATPALVEAVEALSQGFRGGFRFGRYDVRATSLDELRAGRFRVIECNGVTSEAVHIYHPGTPLREGLRVLCEQWSIAFEIGAENAAAGAPVASVGQILRAWWAFRDTARRHPRRGG